MHADRSFAATEELDREATARARAAAWMMVKKTRIHGNTFVLCAERDR
jgi:uncharacterized protein YcbX